MRRRLKTFKQKSPVEVRAVQFVEKDFTMYEPEVHRYPGAGADRSDQGGFVFHGTDDKIYEVKDGDHIVFVEEQVFPSYVALNRKHSFVMTAEEFEEFFDTDLGEELLDETADEAAATETGSDEE